MKDAKWKTFGEAIRFIGTQLAPCVGKFAKSIEALEVEAERERQQDEVAENRRSQVGTGDRSERIRTYNYPQGRVTDHRIGLTLYKIDDIVNGNIDEIIDALTAADRARYISPGDDDQ